MLLRSGSYRETGSWLPAHPGQQWSPNASQLCASTPPPPSRGSLHIGGWWASQRSWHLNRPEREEGSPVGVKGEVAAQGLSQRGGRERGQGPLGSQNTAALGAFTCGTKRETEGTRRHITYWPELYSFIACFPKKSVRYRKSTWPQAMLSKEGHILLSSSLCSYTSLQLISHELSLLPVLLPLSLLAPSWRRQGCTQGKGKKITPKVCPVNAGHREQSYFLSLPCKAQVRAPDRSL